MAENILVIDDDTLMRPSLAVDLERSIYRVSGAASAEQALTLVQVYPPELIFLTARRTTVDWALRLELGAGDHVARPLDLDVLLARVEAAIGAQLAPVAARWRQVRVSAAFAVGVLLLVLAAPQWMGWVRDVASYELPSEEMVWGWLNNLVLDPVTVVNSLVSGAVQAWLNSAGQMDVLVTLAIIILALASAAGLAQLLGDEHQVTFLASSGCGVAAPSETTPHERSS
jgi:CheY-like chemotaxis protein